MQLFFWTRAYKSRILLSHHVNQVSVSVLQAEPQEYKSSIQHIQYKKCDNNSSHVENMTAWEDKTEMRFSAFFA